VLTRAAENEAAGLMPLLEGAPERSVRLSALLRAYGTSRNFFNVWIQDDFGAVISRLEDTFSIMDCGRADLEEAAFFLEFNPYFKRLSGDINIVEQLFPLFGARLRLERVNLMSFDGKGSAARMPGLSRKPQLKTVFDVITGELPQESDYMAWYADLSHRIRHGCARAYLLSDGGEPASACLVSAESNSAGLISGVATRPRFRGRGMATRVIACACTDLAAVGKTPVLECVDEMMPFYKKLGFKKIGDIGELEVI
jgi:GNAT superfamily N-acetyltransferase